MLATIPLLLIALGVANISYLGLISLIPSSFQPLLSPAVIALIRLLLVGVTYLWLGNFRPLFEARPTRREWWLLAPYLVILLVRFPLVYPTYDDLAVHLMWGDYANNMWGSSNFWPMNFGHYFYLPLDMDYTLLLNTLGIRLTIWIFYALTSLWLFSIFIRLMSEAKDRLKRVLLAGLFLLLPLIPHLVGVAGTLMVDYPSLPFCLEALYLLMRRGKDKTLGYLLMVTAVLVKQSNSVFIAPILVYYAVRERRKVKLLPTVIFVTIASLFFVRLYLETGNPISGLFNGIFQSPLYPSGNFSQPLFGPRGWVETLLWPIIGQFGDRYAEGIVSSTAKIFFAPLPIIGYLGSLWLAVRNRSLKYILIVASYLLWSYLVGYARYYIALNLMVLIVMIIDIPAKINHRITEVVSKYKVALFLVILIGSLSSLKTDFSWRPHPSLATPMANAYYLSNYQEGLTNVGRDTLTSMAREYAEIMRDYQAVVTVYRGPVTFVGYMAYLNGLPVYDGVDSDKYSAIMNSPKVSRTIKDNLRRSTMYDRVLILAERPLETLIPTLKAVEDLSCQRIGYGPKDGYLQRQSYFTEVAFYSCQRL